MDEKAPEGKLEDEGTLAQIATEACKGHTEWLPDLIKAAQAYLSGGSVIKAMGLPEELLDKFYEHAYHQYENGLYVQAGNIFTFLYFMHPNRFDYAFARASALHQQKQYDQALMCYNIAAAIETNNPKPYYHMADCYEQQGKPLSAYQTLSTAYMYAAMPGKNPFADRIYDELKQLEKKMCIDNELMDKFDEKTEALMARLDQVQSGKENPQKLLIEIFMHRQALDKEIEERMAKGKKG